MRPKKHAAFVGSREESALGKWKGKTRPRLAQISTDGDLQGLQFAAVTQLWGGLGGPHGPGPTYFTTAFIHILRSWGPDIQSQEYLEKKKADVEVGWQAGSAGVEKLSSEEKSKVKGFSIQYGGGGK